jgi:hypothetical protein
LLDAPRHLELLLYALALAHFLLEAPLRQLCEAAPFAPFLRDLAPLYAVDEDVGHLVFSASGRDPVVFPSIMDKVHSNAAYHLISVGQLVFDHIAEVG